VRPARGGRVGAPGAEPRERRNMREQRTSWASGPARLRSLHAHLAPPRGPVVDRASAAAPAPVHAAAAGPEGPGDSSGRRQQDVPGTGFRAVRTSDPCAALAALRRDGGCIFRAAPEGQALRCDRDRTLTLLLVCGVCARS
jgi:hypothetical protein